MSLDNTTNMTLDDFQSWTDRAFLCRFGKSISEHEIDDDIATSIITKAHLQKETPEEALKLISLFLAKKVWKDLGDVPVTYDEDLDEDFLHFPKGTDVDHVWHWIEEHFDCCIGNDLIFSS